MKKQGHRPVVALLVASLVAALTCAPDREAADHVTVVSAVGSVTVVSGGTKKTPRAGEKLGAGDGIITGKASSIDLLLGESTVIRIYENTAASLSSLLGPKNAEGSFGLEKGAVFVIMSKLRKGDSFRVITPTTTIAVRGTAFRVDDGAKGAAVAVLTGKVLVHAARAGVEKGAGILVEKNSIVEMTAARAGEVASGRAAVPVRTLRESEAKSLATDFLAIKSSTIDTLPHAVREGLQPDIHEVMRDRNAKEARDRALRESLEAKRKAELELQEKLKKEAEEKKKKEDEARARARRAAQQQKPDRSGDVSGSK